MALSYQIRRTRPAAPHLPQIIALRRGMGARDDSESRWFV